MIESCSVIKKEPFTLRDNNGDPMDFDSEIVCGEENTKELFLWVKSTKNAESFNILKFRLKELFKTHKIEPNVSIFKNPQYNGSNGKYFSFKIVKEGQTTIDNIEKYYNRNYNSILICLSHFDIEDLLTLEFPIDSENEASREEVILTNQKRTLLPAILGAATTFLSGYGLYRYFKRRR